MCLSVGIEERAVGNDLTADGATLVMIAGANQGGRPPSCAASAWHSLMMQCGMFVGADSFRADVRDHVLTHFRREEDLRRRR